MTQPRKEHADHAGANGVELDSASGGGDVVEDLEAPDKPDRVRVLVQGGDGSFSVDIAFANTTITKTGGASTDVDVDRAAMSGGTITVTISDTSGASNIVDYDLLVM